MSKELEQLNSTKAKYLLALEYLPNLEMVGLLKECYYGSLGGALGGTGYHINNLVFKTHVHSGSVEVEIYIQHPEDWKRKFVIRHFTKSECRSPTYHSKSQFGKWDKHLEDAIEVIRQGQIKYVEGKLADVNKRIDDLVSELHKEKAEFEMLFD